MSLLLLPATTTATTTKQFAALRISKHKRLMRTKPYHDSHAFGDRTSSALDFRRTRVVTDVRQPGQAANFGSLNATSGSWRKNFNQITCSPRLLYHAFLSERVSESKFQSEDQIQLSKHAVKACSSGAPVQKLIYSFRAHRLVHRALNNKQREITYLQEFCGFDELARKIMATYSYFVFVVCREAKLPVVRDFANISNTVNFSRVMCILQAHA
jgi:hypothetical protein